MRAVVDLSKLMGVKGDIVVRSRDHHSAGFEMASAFLHADDARLDAETDDAFGDQEFPAGYLFRRRYD